MRGQSFIAGEGGHIRLRVFHTFILSAFLFLAVGLPDLSPGAEAFQGRSGRSEVPPVDRVMSDSIGQRVLEAQECADADDQACVIATLTPLLERNPSVFERFVIYRMRGFAYHNTERTDLAIADFMAALETGAAASDEAISLRLNVGQLYIVSDRFDDGIRQIERALADGAELTPGLAFMLAQAYGQAGRFSDGLPYAERQLETGPRDARNFYLLLFYYQQLDQVPDQLRLISQMVERWPDEEDTWTSLVALMAQTNNESGAFEANKLMYLNGMLTEERELVRLAQYYSFFEYPYRGALILEREINAGRVSASLANLEILANMWRQSREYDRAISVLEIIAPRGDGEDYLRLAEAYYQENRLNEAERAFERALALGGLDRPGDAWALLGTVRYELDDRDGATAAFRNCEPVGYSRATCVGWLRFIENENAVILHQIGLQVIVATEECRNTINSELVILTLGVGDGLVDENGRAMINVPERCRDYFNAYGEQIGGHGFEAEET